jgi:AbiV family abortive infection protein
VNKPPPQIPREHLEEGIERCFSRGRALLESALVLVGTERVDPALAANLFVLAVQELGKAKLLHDAYEGGEPKPKIAGFFSHKKKTEQGVKLLGSSAEWLHVPAFEPTAFDPGAFDTGVIANEPTRTKGLYVDYCEGQWLDRLPLSGPEMRKLTEQVLAQLPELERTLLGRHAGPI